MRALESECEALQAALSELREIGAKSGDALAQSLQSEKANAKQLEARLAAEQTLQSKRGRASDPGGNAARAPAHGRGRGCAVATPTVLSGAGREPLVLAGAAGA